MSVIVTPPSPPTTARRRRQFVVCCLLLALGQPLAAMEDEQTIPAPESEQTAASDPAAVLGRKYWGSFADYPQALQRVQRLRSQGHDARVETITPMLQVRSLRIHGYLFRDDAEVVARHLRNQGIEARIELDPDGRIYEVQAGSFSSTEALEQRREQLRFLGYRKIREVESWTRVNKYNVVSLIHPEPPPVFEDDQALLDGLLAEGEAGTDSDSIVLLEDQAAAADADEETIILLGDAADSEEEIILLGEESGSEDEIILLGEETDTDTESVILFDETEVTQLADNDTITYSSPAPDLVDTGFEIVNKSSFDLRFDEILLEAGYLTHKPGDFDTADYARAKLFFRASPFRNWDLYFQARVDKHLQTVHDSYHEINGEVGEAYVRYRGEESRLTLGNQLVLWGRLDGDAPTDKLSARDVTRFFEDDVANRRRPSPTIRYERFLDDTKVDFVLQPRFREAELPDLDSIWSPVDKRLGRLLGIEQTPQLMGLVQNGSVGEYDDAGLGNVGLRISHTGAGRDFAVTVQNFRHSTPSYSVNPAVVANLQQQLFTTGTTNVAQAEQVAGGPTFLAEHPRSWLVGGDLSLVRDIGILRFETALMSDLPVLPENALQIDTVPGLEWGAGWEFYPGDANARFILQLNGRFLFSDQDLVEEKQTVFFNGQLENTFAEDKWRARLNFNVGLHERDIFLNPEIAYVGFNQSEIYLGFLLFDGVEDSATGYYDNYDMAVGGWRIRY